MIPNKKWMVVLTENQYEWVKTTSSKAKVSGAAVLRSLISQAMEQNSADFQRSLMSAQLKVELHALEIAKEKLAEKEKEIRLKMTGREKALV